MRIGGREPFTIHLAQRRFTVKRIDPYLAIGIVPALIVGVLFEVFLGHRHDYTGHFAAGYGGTLGAVMVWLKSMSEPQFGRFGTLSIIPICLACIVLGAFMEATAFRIAKFDEIDFFNQSLGAVLAALAATAHVGIPKLPDQVFDSGLIVGIVFLSAGCCFAVA